MGFSVQARFGLPNPSIFSGTTCSLPQHTGIWQFPQSSCTESPEEPNFLPAKKQGHWLETELGLLEIDPSLPDGHAIATIRPEAIEIGPNGHNNLKAQVKTYSYQGLIARCLTGLDGTELQVVAPPHRLFQVGQEITIHIPRERIWLLPNS